MTSLFQIPDSVPGPAIKLRPYQDEAIAAVEEAQDRGVQRPLVGLPTGTGKTVVFSELIRRRQELGPALVLAHRDELLDQAADKIRQVKPDAWIGKVKAESDEWDMPVAVASVQTLSRGPRLARVPRDRWATIIVDEAHHANADSYMRVLDYFESAPLILGVTATPERADGKPLADVWQEIVYHRGMLEMIDEGYLSDLRGVRVRLKDLDLSSVKVSRGDFQDGASAQALHQAEAEEHAAKAYLEYAEGRKAILFTPTVELAHSMAAELRRVGVAAEAVDGTTPQEERRGIIRRLASGETMVVCNCGVLTEGFDEPSVSCIIVARPTRSRPLYIQMVGRGTRLYPGKEDCLIIDLVGATDDLSLVTMPSLVGLPPKHYRDGASLTAQVKAFEVASRGPVALTDLDAEEVDLFKGRQALHWIRTPGGVWMLPAGKGFVALEQAGGSWNVAIVEGQAKRVLGQGLDLGYAQGVGEDFVRGAGGLILADPNARWREQPATDKQRYQLDRMGIPYPEDVTKGRASDLLGSAFAERDLKKAKVA